MVSKFNEWKAQFTPEQWRVKREQYKFFQRMKLECMSPRDRDRIRAKHRKYMRVRQRAKRRAAAKAK
jgi:hypothetical protein